jgi:hypothetical protein
MGVLGIRNDVHNLSVPVPPFNVQDDIISEIEDIENEKSAHYDNSKNAQENEELINDLKLGVLEKYLL